MKTKAKLPVMFVAMTIVALPQNPFRSQSTSTISLTVKGDERAIEIHNVVYQYTNSQVPGRPHDEELVLRITTDSRDIIGDIGEPVAAWDARRDVSAHAVSMSRIPGTECEAWRAGRDWPEG
jgi:hypothetical protein